MIITIARQCGCEGDEVGRKLSEIYGIPCYSKKRTDRACKKRKKCMTNIHFILGNARWMI